MMPVMMLVMNFATLAIVWFGAHRIEDEYMKVGDLMAFLQYAMMIMFSLIMLSVMFVMIPRAQASAVRINEVLNMMPEIHDPERPSDAGVEHGSIEFQDVTFYYPGAEEPAISDISFHAGPGEVTAIIGGTGSGKSTLISLIPRFYDVTSGRILVNGTDIRDMMQEDLRGRIGFVPQKARSLPVPLRRISATVKKMQQTRRSGMRRRLLRPPISSPPWRADTMPRFRKAAATYPAVRSAALDCKGADSTARDLCV